MRPRLRAIAALPGAFARSLVRLRRFPPVLVAVLGAGAVVGIAAATGPMVVSSAGNAALSSRVSGSTGVPAGVRAEAQIPLTYDRLQFRLPLLRERLRGLPLPPPVVTVLGADEATLSAGGKRATVQMVTRSGFLDHVERVAGDPSADGLWVAESAASELGLRPGDTAKLSASEVATDIRVAGIYRDFDIGHVPDFWNPVIQRIRALPQDPDEPPLMLGNLRPFLDAEAGLTDQGTIAVDVAVPTDLPLRDARRVAGVISTLHDDVIVPESPVYGLFDVVDSLLPSLVEASDQTVATTTQPVQAISLAGELAALILAGAAGMFLARRRSVEFGLLSARGVGPVTIGSRTTVEALLPALAGAAAGLALANVLTRATGPGGVVDASAIGTATSRVVVGAVLASLAVGVLTAVAVRLDSPDRRARGPAVSKAPWEIAMLALAAAAAYEIFTRGGSGSVDSAASAAAAVAEPPKLDLLVLAFPFLFVAGMAGIAVRLLRRALPKIRAATAERRPAVFLTTARMAASPRLASVLVLVAGMAIGVLTYSNVLSASVERTADVKAVLSVGSDVVATTGALPVVTGAPSFEWSPVEVVPGIDVDPGERQVDVIAIDPDSFARAAAWIGAFSGPPPALRSLDAGGTLPAIAIGNSLGPNATLAMAGEQVPVRGISTMRVFPGVFPGHPAIVVDRERFEAVAPTLLGFDRNFQLWARGDSADIVRTLEKQGFDPAFFITAESERSSPGFLALSWTFGLLQTFGALAGIMSVLGAVLYLQARQQQREVTYALARRMGLSRKEHRRSIALELGGMLVAAFLIGAVFATAAAAIVHGKVDPLPTLPPGPLFALPITTLAIVAAVVVALAWLGAMRVQRRADHANVGELLRRAG